MKICVIGLGYIGLPTASMFADNGNFVVGVDKNPAVIEALSRGEIIIEENGLPELVKKVVSEGKLVAKSEPEEADVFIISVPTPITEDKRSDMKYVEAATEGLLPYLKKGDLVILESTSPVGTVDTLMVPILEKSGLKAGVDFYLGHSPERVIPGQILNELVNNNRIAGGLTPECAHKITELYKCFVKGEIYETDARTAELCKLSENTFRDVNIAFANELAKICENLNINVWEVIRLCNKHPRVNIHQPGPGVGGHCISVDPWFLVGDYPSLTKVIGESMAINDSMPDFVLGRIYTIMEENGLTDISRVGLYGLTYKENVDDCRESPTLQLLESQERHLAAPLKVYDPFISEDLVENQYHDFDEFLNDVDLVVVMVGHNQIRENLDKLDGKIVLDTRKVYKTATDKIYYL